MHRTIPIRRRFLLPVTLAATLSLAWTLLLAAPGLVGALQGPPEVALREASVAGGARMPAGATTRLQLPIRTNLLGASWVGSASEIEVRTRRVGERWSQWAELVASPGEAPDPDSHEARRMQGRSYVATPAWVGDADQVQVRVGHAGGTSRAGLRDLRLVSVNVEGTAGATARATTALKGVAAGLVGSLPTVAGGGSTAQAATYLPDLNARASWDARAPKTAATLSDGVRAVVVHHTVDANGYSCSSVPRMIRGIQTYHMDANGWDDIGYNALIDRCGRIWEGRNGGLVNPAIGAHTYGFNTNTSGVAMIGEHGAVRPSSAAMRSLYRFTSFRLDLEHVDPRSRQLLVARANDKFNVGDRVWTRAVSGHRNLFSTACPGAAAYGTLGAVARVAWRSGGPKVATPRMQLRTNRDGTVEHMLITATTPVPGGWDLRIVQRSTGRLIGRSIHRRWLANARLGWTPRGGAVDVPAWDIRTYLVTGRMGTRARAWRQARLMEVPADPKLRQTVQPSFMARGAGTEDERLALRARVEVDHPVRVRASLVDVATGREAWRVYAGRLRAGSSWLVPDLPPVEELPDGGYVLRVRTTEPVPGLVQEDERPDRASPLMLDRVP